MEVKVGCITYEVKEDSAQHQDDRRGATYKELSEIRINPHLSSKLKEITLLHEVLHACADFTGIESEKLTEEQWVVRISPILLTVLKENKGLFIQHENNH